MCDMEYLVVPLNRQFVWRTGEYHASKVCELLTLGTMVQVEYVVLRNND